MSSSHNKKVKILFACLDWRLHPQIENYFTNHQDGCDLCVTAGSIKGLIEPQTRDFLLSQIEISHKLHNCQAIVLTIHLDCGAYGGSKAFAAADAEMEHHKKQLETANEIVRQKFPDIPVEKYVIGLSENNGLWNMDPIKLSK